MHSSRLGVTRALGPPGAPRSRAPAAPPVRAAAGSSNNALPYLRRIERLDTATLHRYSDLDQVESELNTYCSNLSAEDSPEKCWQAYSFLERRREVATASCDWDRPESCADLEKLNTMAHELLATGSMDDVVATFSTLARVEEMRAARNAHKAAKEVESEEDVMERVFNTEEEEYLHALFTSMDADGDGRLSMVEFRQSMAMLGDELDGSTVALIGDAMDIHGFVSEQQFRDIVEAEAINSQSEVAKLWRHHHHPKRRPMAVPRLSW